MPETPQAIGTDNFFAKLSVASGESCGQLPVGDGVGADVDQLSDADGSSPRSGNVGSGKDCPKDSKDGSSLPRLGNVGSGKDCPKDTSLSVKDGSRKAGGDWYRRQDGRRPRPDLPESAVFGPKKVRFAVEFDHDNIPVEVSGHHADAVAPIALFSQAGLSDSVLGNLRRCGYAYPTPIQKYSIPIVMSGRDLMASSQTGSGKTCAYMVPCLEALLRKGPPVSSCRKPSPCGLVLAPTKELATQIHAESVKFSYCTGVRTCLVIGGADPRAQQRELKDGCDIVVATPGRLGDMYERRTLSLSLVHFLILDEADGMLDMGFEPQVRQIVEHTDMRRSGRQSMMFSATFSKVVQLLACDFLNDHLFLTVGGVGKCDALITQKVMYAEEDTKMRSLEKALKDYQQVGKLTLIFVGTKKDADTLETDLYAKNIPVAAIHGDRTYDDRKKALAAFKSGNNPVLIATDVMAKGMDIEDITLVINFSMPNDLDHYVQRMGRIRTKGEKKGVVVSLLNKRCNYLHDLRDSMSEANQEVPSWFHDLCKSMPSQPKAQPNQQGESSAQGKTKTSATGFGLSGQDDAWD